MSWNPRPFGMRWAKPGRCRCPPVTSMALLRDIVEDLEAVFRGERFADVVLARDLGPGNLDLRHVHGVSPHHQGLARGIEAIAAMSRAYGQEAAAASRRRQPFRPGSDGTFRDRLRGPGRRNRDRASPRPTGRREGSCPTRTRSHPRARSLPRAGKPAFPPYPEGRSCGRDGCGSRAPYRSRRA